MPTNPVSSDTEKEQLIRGERMAGPFSSSVACQKGRDGHLVVGAQDWSDGELRNTPSASRKGSMAIRRLRRYPCAHRAPGEAPARSLHGAPEIPGISADGRASVVFVNSKAQTGEGAG